jgi:3-dehydroquinate dehydratase type I
MDYNNRICISHGGDYETFIEISKEYKFIEIRIDQSTMTDEELKKAFSSDIITIACCKNSHHIEKLTKAAEWGADFIDIDITTDSFELLLDTARAYNCKKILSYHNYELTPPKRRLQALIERCANYGADICKIVCMPQNIKDVLRMMRLYTSDELAFAENMDLISFAMNKQGRISRISSMEFGAPYMYCAIDEASRTSAGQFPVEEFKTILGLCSGE